MRINDRVTLAWGAAALIALAGCAGEKTPPGEPASADKATAEHSSAAHPETFEAAKALAAERSLPLLVDFYSPS